MYLDFILDLYIFILTGLILILMFKYVLISLIILEFMILSISVIMFNIFSLINYEFSLIYYWVFMVCESVLGLMMLVLMVRYYNGEMYNMFNMLKY